MVWRYAFDLRAFGEQGKDNSSRCHCNNFFTVGEMKRDPCMDPTFVMCICVCFGPVKHRRRSGHAVPLHGRTGLPQRWELGANAAQLFASLVDERAHFGKGLYATQHEPADARPE